MSSFFSKSNSNPLENNATLFDFLEIYLNLIWNQCKLSLILISPASWNLRQLCSFFGFNVKSNQIFKSIWNWIEVDATCLRSSRNRFQIRWETTQLYSIFSNSVRIWFEMNTNCLWFWFRRPAETDDCSATSLVLMWNQSKLSNQFGIELKSTRIVFDLLEIDLKFNRKRRNFIRFSQNLFEFDLKSMQIVSDFDFVGQLKLTTVLLLLWF